jgi:hypothetical protein
LATPSPIATPDPDTRAVGHRPSGAGVDCATQGRGLRGAATRI